MLFHDQNEFDVSPSRMCSVDQTDRTISLLPQLTGLPWSASLLVFCAKTTISGSFFVFLTWAAVQGPSRRRNSRLRKYQCTKGVNYNTAGVLLPFTNIQYILYIHIRKAVIAHQRNPFPIFSSLCSARLPPIRVEESSFSQDMQWLLERGVQFADVAFYAGDSGKELGWAHAAVLCAVSPYFRQLLLGPKTR